MITVLESHPSSHHSPSPLPLTSHHSYSLLLTPFPITISHHSPQLTPLGLFTPLPPHPTTHHYSPSLHPLITPLTTGPLTTPSHPTSPTLLTARHLLTTLFTTPVLTYLSYHASSPPSSSLLSSPLLHHPLPTPSPPPPRPLTPNPSSRPQTPPLFKGT